MQGSLPHQYHETFLFDSIPFNQRRHKVSEQPRGDTPQHCKHRGLFLQSRLDVHQYMSFCAASSSDYMIYTRPIIPMLLALAVH